MSNVTDGTSKKGGAFLAQLWAKHKKLSKSQRNHQYAVFERDSENADLILKKMWWFIGVFCKFLLILRYCFFLSTGVKTSEYCETVEFNVRATFSRFECRVRRNVPVDPSGFVVRRIEGVVICRRMRRFPTLNRD